MAGPDLGCHRPPGQSLATKYSTAFYQPAGCAGRIYPAYETEAELERQRSLLAARKLPPVYNRASLDPANKQKWEAEGRTPHWRFKLSADAKVKWTRPGAGTDVEIDTATMSDPVLVREDGAFLYTLPSVADDIDMAITHVVRGEDHVTNTAAQIEIFEALGAAVPALRAFPAAGRRRRRGAVQAAGLAVAGAACAMDGIEPLAVAAYLAKIGTSRSESTPRLTLGELAHEFDLRQDRPRPRAFRARRTGSAERQDVLHLSCPMTRSRLARSASAKHCGMPFAPTSPNCPMPPKGWRGWSPAP